MKKAFIIIGVIVVVIGGFIFASPKSSNQTATNTKQAFNTIRTDVASGKAHLIDVRTPAEYTAGHFEGATNFDSVRVEAGQLPDLAKDAQIYLYCHSGRRAGIVKTAMEKAGFTNVQNLGGITDVEALGGKIVK